MILKSFSISNFRCFGNEVKFKFKSPQKKRNVYLVGGMNGQGKTTFLEALKACLFGIEKLADRSNLLNRTSLNKDAFLALEFDHDDKSWIVVRVLDRPSKLLVQIEGEEEDKPHKVEDEEAQILIESIFPGRLSDFFLFDGEEIQKLAEKTDGDSAKRLKNDIDTLLGLEVFKKLFGDLDSLRAEQSKKTKKSNTAIVDFAEKESQLETVRKAIQNLDFDISELKDRLDPLQKILRESRSEYESVSSSSHQLTQLIDKRARLETERASLIDSLNSFVKHKLPYAIVAQSLILICRSLNERDGKTDRFAELINEKLNNLDSRLTESSRCLCNQLLPSEGIRKVIQELRQAFFVQTESNESELVLPEVTRDKYSVLKGHLDAVQHAKSFDDNLERLLQVEGDLNTVQEDIRKQEQNQTEQNRNILNLYREKTNEVSNIQTEIVIKQKEIENLRDTEEKLKKELSNAYAELEDKDREAQILKKMNAILKVVETVQTKIRNSKLKELEENVTDLFRFLWKKSQTLKRVQIDPETYIPTILNADGNEISKSELSAGEKELFALSILGGLAKCSGSRLPVIIDTPLSRLDSEHRDHIVTSYYPRASHQVFLLSTDTEITQDLYQLLEPQVRQSITLENNPHTQQTTFRDGFFHLSGG